MKIKLFAKISCFCLCCFISIYVLMLVGRGVAEPQPTISSQVRVQPTIALKSYILPYYKQAIFRFTQPAPRQDFMWEGEEDRSEKTELNLSLIDKVIVIPIPVRA